MKPNHYTHRISKDLIHWMPTTQFEGEVVIVDCEEEVREAIEYLGQQRMIGVDTESRPSFVRGLHYPTALLQTATEQRCYLFRLSQTGLPEEVAGIFANPDICKIGLAFRDDIKGLQRLRSFTPRNCIDLQNIAGRYGILDLGLQKMFAICFGKRISKSQQLTNWENKQLTEQQARYASTDAWATLLIYKELMQTEPLSDEEAAALHRADMEKQLAHQREVQEARKAENS